MNDSWRGRELLLQRASRWAEQWSCDRPVSEWCRGRAKRKEQMMERSLCHSADTWRAARSGGGGRRRHDCVRVESGGCMWVPRRKTGRGGGREWKTLGRSTERGERGCIFWKAEPDTQVSLQIFPQTISRTVRACLPLKPTALTEAPGWRLGLVSHCSSGYMQVLEYRIYRVNHTFFNAVGLFIKPIPEVCVTICRNDVWRYKCHLCVCNQNWAKICPRHL